MTKAELIAIIAEKTGLSKSQAESVFSATFETITELLAKQDDVMVPGFGKFGTKVRAERQGRNPSTGAQITIPEAKVANFKPASQLKATINNS